MGISFKVSKTGTRFRPKPPLPSDTNVVADDDVSDNNASSNSRKLQVERKEHVAGVAGSSMSSEGLLVSAETEASFTLNLFPDGYSIGKPSENENAHQDVPKLLHPYNRTSETLFSAIESGRLPGDILDDIPCKYIDGTLVCEVRDYHKCVLEQGPVSPPDGSLIVNKVRLRMSLENVVKDIPLISDNSWSYGDLMEVESRILKALQPQLHLDPTPMLDRLCKNPVPTKLDLALTSIRRKRLRQIPEVTVTSNSKTHGKKICIDRVPENSNSRLGDSGILSGNLMPHYGHENLNTQNLGVNNIALRSKNFMPDVSIPSPHLSRYQIGVGTPRNMQDHGSGPVVNASASSGGQEMMILYADNVTSNASHPGKREHQDGQISPLSFNKRSRSTRIGLDAMQHQQIGPIDNFNASDMNWKNTLLQQPMAKGMQYPNTGTQKFSPQVFEGALNQDGGTMPFAVGQPNMRYVAKEEQFETGKVEGSELSGIKNDMQMVEGETSHLDLQLSRFPQRLPQHPFMRSNYSQISWNNLGQNIEKDARKDDQFSKRKSVQSPRLSGGATVQSPLSSKSADFSSGFVGPHFGVAATSAFGVSQKEKPAISSAGIGTVSLTSSGNGSMHRQHQAHFAAKRKSNSLPKTSAMSGVGSPASVSNISMPLNANSPSVGTPSSADESMLERLSKITQVTMRYQLNGKKNKVDNYSRKPNTYPAQHLMACLSNVSNNEDFKDDSCVSPLSKSLVGGSMNICKTRILNFVEQVQGAGFSYVPKAQTRTIMSEKPNDGTVAIYHGEIQDSEFLSAEEFLPTLPNTHLADLLAAQFCSLMVHDGYTLVEDHVQPKPTRVYLTPGNDGAGLLRNNSAVEMQQYADAVSGQPSNDVKPMIVGNASLNPPQNLLPSTRMLPPGNPQAVQMSQGLLSGTSVPPHPQQLDSPSSLQQQQQQQHHQQQQQHHQQQQQQQQQQMQQHQQHQPQQTQRFLIQQQHPQHPQLQRSMMLAAGNPLSQLNAIGQTSNVQLGNLVNKLPLQYIYQQQQQQQPQMQRKMMMGLGSTMAMGTLGNNMVGISGLGNAMGMGAGRGIAGAGMSAPMTPISGMGNVAQNQMNALNQQRIQALMTTKLRMQNRGNILGVPQTSIAGMSGARQMHPGSAGLSMLGQARNRANMSPMQQAAMAPMGPPKLMQGMNIYMNSQQQQQQKQQQQQQMQMQQQQLQQQLQQQQPQQQDTNSPLQAVLSPPQVSSPSTMGIPQMNQQIQQQASPQQMSQRTPMSPQLSSGAIHAMSAGNPEGCPASPQLSSQTHGSVGSIANSPMELQAANNSAGNA